MLSRSHIPVKLPAFKIKKTSFSFQIKRPSHLQRKKISPQRKKKLDIRFVDNTTTMEQGIQEAQGKKVLAKDFVSSQAAL